MVEGRVGVLFGSKETSEIEEIEGIEEGKEVGILENIESIQQEANYPRKTNCTTNKDK